MEDPTLTTKQKALALNLDGLAEMTLRSLS